MKYTSFLIILELVAALPLMNQLVAEGIANISCILETAVYASTGEVVIKLCQGYNDTESLSKAVEDLGTVEGTVEVSRVRIVTSPSEEIRPTILETETFIEQQEYELKRALVAQAQRQKGFKQYSTMGALGIKGFKIQGVARGGCQAAILKQLGVWADDFDFKNVFFGSSEQGKSILWGQDAWVYHYVNSGVSQDNFTTINSMTAICLNDKWGGAIWCESKENYTISTQNALVSDVDTTTDRPEL